MQLEKKNLSPKKIEANRRNALQSTGPKTQKGKKAVRWNALKHGLLAREVLIKAGDGKEIASEFRNLLDQLQEDLQPVGVLEQMLVEKIAVCYWRLRRVLRVEVGEIRKDLDMTEEKFWDKLARHAAFAKQSDSPLLRSGLRDNSVGLRWLMETLAEVREEVDTLGRLSEPAYNELLKYFGIHAESVANRCRSVARELTGEPTVADPEKADNILKKQKDQILEILDQEEQSLHEMWYRATAREDLEMDATAARLSLPSKEAVDKILRYETALEKQLYRAMNQLERLRRLRMGDVVPPPLHVELSNQN